MLRLSVLLVCVRLDLGLLRRRVQYRINKSLEFLFTVVPAVVVMCADKVVLPLQCIGIFLCGGRATAQLFTTGTERSTHDVLFCLRALPRSTHPVHTCKRMDRELHLFYYSLKTWLKQKA